MNKITDPEVAAAHLILVRDGLLPLNTFFKSTQHIPNRYVNYYSKSLGRDESRQICYESYLQAIRDYPIGNKANFFAWSGMTIFRNLMEEIRKNSRADRIKVRAARTIEQTLGEVVGPEDAYFASEMPKIINREINSLGSVYRDAIKRRYDGSPATESRFKGQRHAAEALALLRTSPALQDYYE